MTDMLIMCNMTIVNNIVNINNNITTIIFTDTTFIATNTTSHTIATNMSIVRNHANANVIIW